MSKQDKTCLFNAIYYESNTDSAKGKRAVAAVVLNRAKKQKKSVCSIVKAKGQFSWVGKKKFIPLDNAYLSDTLRISSPIGSEYTHFYLSSMKRKPVWRKKMMCKPVGKHHFCKLKEK